MHTWKVIKVGWSERCGYNLLIYLFVSCAKMGTKSLWVTFNLCGGEEPGSAFVWGGGIWILLVLWHNVIPIDRDGSAYVFLNNKSNSTTASLISVYAGKDQALNYTTIDRDGGRRGTHVFSHLHQDPPPYVWERDPNTKNLPAEIWEANQCPSLRHPS